MSFIVETSVEAYAAEHSTPESDLFARLAAETREKTTLPQMMVGRLEGRLLAELVRLSRAQRVLELGTFTGYSSISIALDRALDPLGRAYPRDLHICLGLSDARRDQEVLQQRRRRRGRARHLHRRRAGDVLRRPVGGALHVRGSRRAAEPGAGDPRPLVPPAAGRPLDLVHPGAGRAQPL